MPRPWDGVLAEVGALWELFASRPPDNPDPRHEPHDHHCLSGELREELDHIHLARTAPIDSIRFTNSTCLMRAAVSTLVTGGGDNGVKYFVSDPADPAGYGAYEGEDPRSSGSI